MNHIMFHENPQVAILIKDSYFIRKDIENYYVKPLGLNCMAFSLYYEPNNKITATKAKDYLKKILPALVKQGISYLYVADSTYFKVLTKQRKAEPFIGYVLPCTLQGYEHLQVIYGINYGQVIYNNNMSSRLDLSLNALQCSIRGVNNIFGDTIQEAIYEAPERLHELLDCSKLAIDIETTGLTIKDSIVSIAFATSTKHGMAFSLEDKSLIKTFFERFRGRKIFHNATFDVKMIIKECFMSSPTDYQGLLHGLHTMCRNLHDTKIIAYLATNNTQGNSLSLKDLSHEFMGNYAVDVSDVTKLDKDTLLEYNLKDCLATIYVYDKYYPLMVQDNQLDIYEDLMLPTLRSIIHTELSGMPIDLDKVKQVEKDLNLIKDEYINQIFQSDLVLKVQSLLNQKAMAKYNSTHKKQKTLDEFNVKFNPNSNQHLQMLLYQVMQLPILDYTNNKEPATGGDTLKKLLNHTKETKLLEALIGYMSVEKILATFIPAFKRAIYRDGHFYLHGNFNITGTISGRLSSSKPNLTQIPSNSAYGKLIKTCFKAPKGWIFCGADFNALESRINTLLTKDENKLKVFLDGLDSHSFNAFSFWQEQMPQIQQAKQDELCIKINGVYLKSDDTIHYQNKSYTVKEFYESYSKTNPTMLPKSA